MAKSLIVYFKYIFYYIYIYIYIYLTYSVQIPKNSWLRVLIYVAKWTRVYIYVSKWPCVLIHVAKWTRVFYTRVQVATCILYMRPSGHVYLLHVATRFSCTNSHVVMKTRGYLAAWL
jgi:hypothetical protein